LGLVVVAAVVVLTEVITHRLTRPDVRRPGEALPDITESLSRKLPDEAPTPRFTDVTSAAGLGGFSSFTGERSSQLPEDMGSGAAWGDFDNDGDEDLFLVSAGGALWLPRESWAPSELYENRGDGTFGKVEEFPETRIAGMAAAWGDYNADGWPDLVVTGYHSLQLYRNEQGRLVRDAGLPKLDGYWAGAAWADFDNDRDLDLYVCGYVVYVEDAGGRRRATEQYGTAVPYTLNPASFEPERNLLFENNGDGTFTEAALEHGVSNPGGRSLSALWQDFDDDGWLDLYVANDISDNALFLNRQGTFEDAGLAAWVADYRGAMGLATGDWNRDGDDDLFVTHWIAQENALYDSRLLDMQRVRTTEPWISAAGEPIPADPPPPVQLTFSDLAAPLGLGQIALHSVGWGTEFADFDGDGWLDLVVANGSTLETAGEPKRLKPEPAMLLWNRRGEYFHDLAPRLDLLSAPHVSRGLAVSDYDQDGDLDILMVRLGEGVQLLRNDMQTGSWLQVKLRSRLGPAGEQLGRGEGSKVTVHVGDVALRRTVTGASYLSQSSRTLHFGLGAADAVDRVEVRWLGGRRQVFDGLLANSVWALAEGDPVPRRVWAAGGQDSARQDRQRRLEFWSRQRAAMDAMKVEDDIPKATGLFREALVLDPRHEDSRYYLANCLAVQGEVQEALVHLQTLMEINPLSHRAHKQWGVIRAMTAESAGHLDAAAEVLKRSLEINPEETGALLVLGEIALIRAEDALADRRFEWACRTNPRAVGGLYLRGYLAWKAGRRAAASAYLARAAEARAEAWKPTGAVAEGDVALRMHREVSPLSSYWEGWDGSLDPDLAFAELHSFLSADHPWS
jgi:tetratricopeptide (TPR) repeat protein